MGRLRIAGGLTLASLLTLADPGTALGGGIFKKHTLYVVPIQPVATAPSPVVLQAPAAHGHHSMMTVGSAPLIYSAPSATTYQYYLAPAPTTGAAPQPADPSAGTGAAPTGGDNIRLSQALRRALYEDMRRELQQGHGLTPGLDRSAAIRDLKEQSREIYADYLGEDDVTGLELNRDEIELINQYVDYLLSEREGPKPTFPHPAQPAPGYHHPYAAHPVAYPGPPSGVFLVPTTPAPAPAPTGYLVPVYPRPHPIHQHFQKR
ncbi:hypothetical protein BH23PLA1_BH23PLA1_16190 [soil metagenome]